MKKNENPPTDEELLDMHRRARTRRKRRIIITLVVIVAVVLVAVAAGVTAARRRIAEQFASTEEDAVQSAQVTRGSISTTVSGSGTLADEDVESVQMPDSLTIADYCVEEGDTVEEGDLIATVTSASLLSAMSDAQAALDALDEEIEEASGDEVDDEITAAVSGRVKEIFAEEGDDVASVMYRDGALLLLSLDGYMEVDIDAGNLAAGETVTVTASGSSYEGTVDAVAGGTAAVLVTDSGPACGDEAEVTDGEGTVLGTGTLTIHRSMAVTGYAGTVSAVKTSADAAVSPGDTLFTLTDTSTSASYDALLKERETAEEELDDLIAIYKQGGVTAAQAGEITSLPLTEENSSADMSAVMGQTAQTAGGSSGDGTTVATICGNETMTVTISVDETDILSLSEGQEASVTVDSVGEDAFAGTVTEIGTAASSGSGVTTYTAVITLEKTEGMLSGMSASVDVAIEGVDDALLIPADALHQTSSMAYVYTEYDEETGEFSGMTEVTTGLVGSSYVEITAGLDEGDTVYYTESSDSGFSFGFSRGDMSGFGDFSGNMPDGAAGGAGGFGGSMPGGMSGGMPGGN